MKWFFFVSRLSHRPPFNETLRESIPLKHRRFDGWFMSTLLMTWCDNQHCNSHFSTADCWLSNYWHDVRKNVSNIHRNPNGTWMLNSAANLHFSVKIKKWFRLNLISDSLFRLRALNNQEVKFFPSLFRMWTAWEHLPRLVHFRLPTDLTVFATCVCKF